MVNVAQLLFHGSLNDFLPSGARQQWMPYSFMGAPAVKDVIEACNVPHPEVGSISVNGREATFSAPLPHQGKVEVFPVVPEGSGSPLPSLQIPAPVPAAFILDAHLGKLARYLRLLGFDAFYENEYDELALVHLAVKEQRIVLTRDVGLLKHKPVRWGYWLRSQQWEEQLREVMVRFNLAPQLAPFTRCLVCNGKIQEVEKQDILHLLEPKTKQYFHLFYQCTRCQQVYWKGSHFGKMLSFVEHLQEDNFKSTF
ncbi:Mut7-C RNAse domain-containing protein [Rufibacter sp. XAAS-G3-1]|uniref:Mut7-C RNAse domain-containing protein n=1 Tax=Rufibacter sp. XAAS-G3-1 TaxID=2729134 RepID=UPI0015E74643|nr:Mut7-C RNAse domain-containing protein [Rufibacter sp. XAAS-G3-1]